MVMLDMKSLKVGRTYIHVGEYGNSNTPFVFQGRTKLARYTIVIAGGKEMGVESFLIPGDKIIEC